MRCTFTLPLCPVTTCCVSVSESVIVIVSVSVSECVCVCVYVCMCVLGGASVAGAAASFTRM